MSAFANHDPTFGSEYCGELDDQVIVIESDTNSDPPRAYSTWVLHYPETVNDAPAIE